MLDKHLEPESDFHCDLADYKWEMSEPMFLNEDPTEPQIEIAEFNYECLVFNEPERKKVWR